ncbi:winged helix-turn-helix transcriptional regulator [Natrarchaeobius chitinivorans]|uniref:HoxA-like transcriptional regulator n=1 Tax=Natrarchaeobius chitinivorans TaxID=1679083 RepID=A0A3N6MHD4_NATCH|nr:winged helix-turn-helix transcriptional regulator [Natrarchaeobius chitinivorans]RQG93436.1 HoxA-like transcriptional regulator [Natrarchaeobius chitinivorans]
MPTHVADVPISSHVALEALSLLSKKWHPVVVLTLHHRGSAGFNELLAAIPDVSGKVLSETLEGLADAELVERTVVSESPLRVEYALTNAGEDLQPVFSALSEWGERHLEAVTPTVLLADANHRMTDMYSQWLVDRYTVRRAHDDDEFASKLDESVDVVCFDEDLPGVTPADLVESVPPTCRTILLVGDRPAFDLIDVDCDALFRKPIVSETVREAIDEQLQRRGESAENRERASLSARRELLEAAYPQVRLEENEAYADLCDRLETDDR